MVKCSHCHENAYIIYNTDPLCEKHYEHFKTDNPFENVEKLVNQKTNVTYIKCEKVFNRKWLNRIVGFTTNEEYLSVLDEFNKDVRTVKRKTKLYNK